MIYCFTRNVEKNFFKYFFLLDKAYTQVNASLANGSIRIVLFLFSPLLKLTLQMVTHTTRSCLILNI